MKQRCDIRRIIARASVFLLLGAIVNVAVAWGFLEFQPSIRTLIAIQNDIYPLSYRNKYVEGERGTPITWLIPTTDTLRSVSVGEQTQLDQRFVKSRLKDDLNPRRAMECRVVTGWPEAAMGTTWQPWNEFVDVHLKNDWWLIQRATSPIWPGFAINTLFYAAIVWGLFAAPFALRRRRRIKRGLCPKCAYPIGASDVCTECGTAVTRIQQS